MATAGTEVVLLQSRRPKAERHEGEFVGKKDGPTVIFDSNFFLKSPECLGFVNECVDWAKKLNEIAGGISLKFIPDTYTPAQFMWTGKLFVALSKPFVFENEPWQHFRDLVSKTIGQTHCDGAPKAEVWEKVFKPNLYLVVNREKWRLEKLGQDICAIKNPETNEESSQK